MGEVPINRFNIRDLPKPDFIEWLVEEDDVRIDGAVTRCFRIEGVMDDGALQRWALHVRRHYIRDDELDRHVEFYDLDRESYLSVRPPLT